MTWLKGLAMPVGVVGLLALTALTALILVLKLLGQRRWAGRSRALQETAASGPTTTGHRVEPDGTGPDGVPPRFVYCA